LTGFDSSHQTLKSILFPVGYVLDALRRRNMPPTMGAAIGFIASDQGFEALLLEILRAWQITVPKLGTITQPRCPLSS
jgi:hypothetical protein